MTDQIAEIFVDLDGDREPTLWRRTDRPHAPAAVLRRCDLPCAHRDLWDRLTAAFGATGQSPPAPRWRCEMHNIWTAGDCLRCDDELITLTTEEAGRG